MPLTMKEYLERKPSPQEPTCPTPGCTGYASADYRIDGISVCEDCYFDALGKIVEEFPIGRP
jgi:hypothetical protein